MEKLPPYEIIGDIAILECDREQALKASQALLQRPYIKTILRKVSAVAGVLRTRELEYVAGENKTVTIHKEHGLKFYVDVSKVYFSPRLSEERKRIALQVKEHEKIAVLFSGVAPFSLVIWKYNKDKNIEIINVELNKIACYYADKNLEVNKAFNIKNICDDVKNIYNYGQYKNWADRVIAPLPKDVQGFFDEIKYVAKQNAICHLYIFAKNKEEAIEKTKELGKPIFVRQCGSYSKNISRFVVDILMLNE
jgi:tRNA (guanine37-N1)-methyltransferase